jgi:hypothetical protein
VGIFRLDVDLLAKSFTAISSRSKLHTCCATWGLSSKDTFGLSIPYRRDLPAQTAIVPARIITSLL